MFIQLERQQAQDRMLVPLALAVPLALVVVVVLVVVRVVPESHLSSMLVALSVITPVVHMFPVTGTLTPRAE